MTIQALLRGLLTLFANQSTWLANFFGWPDEGHFQVHRSSRNQRKYDRALDRAWRKALWGSLILAVSVHFVLGWQSLAVFSLLSWSLLSAEVIAQECHIFESRIRDAMVEVAGTLAQGLAVTALLLSALVLVLWGLSISPEGLFVLSLPWSCGAAVLASLVFVLPACQMLTDKIISGCGYEKVFVDRAFLRVRLAPVYDFDIEPGNVIVYRR